MEAKVISTVLEKARHFVEEGCCSLIQDGPLTPERFLISPCPVSTALAMMSFLAKPARYSLQISSGLRCLENSRNHDGGWSRAPGLPSDERSSLVCLTAINCAQKGLNPEAIHAVAATIGATWLQDVPRLILDWPADSPLIKLLETFITNKTVSGIFSDISFEHLPAVLAMLPPAGRPLLLALACIRQAENNRNPRNLQAVLKRLVTFQAPNGGWCEDILITAICILCLSVTGRYPVVQARGLKWLASVQYPSGAWPSFNQLTNWDVGMSAYVLHETGLTRPELLTDCAAYLSVRANRDGSYGTLSPYSFPDLDDSAIALLGTCAGSSLNPDFKEAAARTGELLKSLQNRDGSWGTFPEVTGTPPLCTCQYPVHIKSVDVTVHVLQSLLKAKVPANSPHVQKGFWWLFFHQKWDGSWKSTWYTGDAYATAQTLELLCQYNLWPRSRAKARNWLLTAQNTNGGWPIGSAGECGLALTALLKNGENPSSFPIQKGLAYLCSRQNPDGSFKPTYGGLYASGLNYEDPITEALAAIRAIWTYQKAVKQRI